jgi:hypothetical protein
MLSPCFLHFPARRRYISDYWRRDRYDAFEAEITQFRVRNYARRRNSTNRTE